MNFSEKYRVYWYTPERTGARSVQELLKSLGFEINGHSFNYNKNNLDYFFISNIRNPYSRLVSIFYLYSLHVENFTLDFKRWVFEKLKNRKLLSDYQINYHHTIQKLGRPFDKFVRMEFFEKDILSLYFLDLSKPEIKETFDNQILYNGHTNEFKTLIDGGKKYWKVMYDEETANYVFEFLKDQFEFFSYDKNSWINVTP